RIDLERQRIGDRRAAVSTLAKRSRAAQHQQPTAALLDELRNHLELIAREDAGLDRSEDERAIPEQLFARLREATLELVGILRVVAEQPHELVVRGPLQRNHLEVLVVGDRAAQELHLPSRLALEIEDLFARVAHVDQRLAHVVLRDELARLRRDLELEQP